LWLLAACREENSLADLLSNLAMDSDAAVDKVVLAWQQGGSREQLAELLAAGAQVNGDIRCVCSGGLSTGLCGVKRGSFAGQHGANLLAAALAANLWAVVEVVRLV
jgi:hypothetical protein